MRTRFTALVAVALAGALVLSACGDDGDTGTTGTGTSGSASPSTTDGPSSNETINIVGFAVPEAANKAIAAAWNKTPGGKGVSFKTSYGASGDQSRAVVAGLKADYVHLSVASDVTRLVTAKLVAEDWNKGTNKGVVSSSIVVFGVRPGNPKNIKTWDDLVKPGIGIVTANPASSGAARWNALAAWGQVIQAGGTEAQATEYITKWINNVATFTSSGRDTTTAFLGGTGDVAMLYENEAILARQKGEKLDYIIPDTTLLIENPGAITVGSTPKAKAWLDYVLSKDGQLQFALTGFRPIVDGVTFDEVKGANDPKKPFPVVKNLLTVDKNFTSWDALSKKFFDEKEGIVTKLILASGKAK